MSLRLVRIKPYWAEVYDKKTLIGVCGRATDMGWYFMEISFGNTPNDRILCLPKDSIAMGFPKVQTHSKIQIAENAL